MKTLKQHCVNKSVCQASSEIWCKMSSFEGFIGEYCGEEFDLCFTYAHWYASKQANSVSGYLANDSWV